MTTGNKVFWSGQITSLVYKIQFNEANSAEKNSEFSLNCHKKVVTETDT